MDQAEQLRKLVINQDRPVSAARVITVTSGKGGVGKSSISVNLALKLAKKGKRVVIFDADFGLANIEVMLGIRPLFSLADLMFRGKSLKDIITEGPEGLGFISGGSGIQELSRLTRDQILYLTQKLVRLDELADIIIIDTGAGIDDSVLEFVAASTEVLLVSTPEPTSITDAYALLKTLNRKAEFSSENTRIRMIANRIASEKEGIDLFTKLSVVVDKFLEIKLDYFGGVPQDSNMSKAVMKQAPVTAIFPSSPAAKALARLADQLILDVEDKKPAKKGIAQLFSSLIKSERRKGKT